MSKEFKGVASILGAKLDRTTKPEKVNKGGRPKSNFKTLENTSEKGTKAGETRATIIVKKETLAQIKALSYWERLPVKDIIAKALETEIAKYLKELGEIKPLPKNKTL
jgi:hypothetical protein